MLATEHTLDPEALYTINAGGFSATADAFARDEATPTASGSSRWSAPRRRSRRSGPPCSSSRPTSPTSSRARMGWRSAVAMSDAVSRTKQLAPGRPRSPSCP